jgi:hypothetical protein
VAGEIDPLRVMDDAMSAVPLSHVVETSLYVVFLVEEDVRVERRRTCDCPNHEEIDWQYKICTGSYQKHRNEDG